MQDAGFVRQAFTRIAPRYVLTNHVLSLGIDILWRKYTARLIAEQPPAWVLDLATGSGDLAIAVQQACPQAQVLGGDFTPPMMTEAQRSGFHHLIGADALQLPVTDAAFDVVTVAFGLRNMASWPNAIREMARALRPGGRLFVLDFSLPTLPLLRPLYVFYLEKIMPRIAGLLTGHKDAFEYLCQSIERFPSGKAMEAMLIENGFATAETKPLSFGIASLYIATKQG
jgi:demethylmenaquinone methyltransferase/2-methoxy-6-polyprenyl-1,4-benzoquinol methylase